MLEIPPPHTHTHKQFLRFCADTDVLRQGCKKINISTKTAAAAQTRTAGDASVCRLEK